MISAYPKIHNLGHPEVRDLFNGSVVIQEKVDGSQFSFMIDDAGELHCRSKNREINVAYPDGMFNLAVASVKRIADRLTPGFVYRGEYLKSPNHNHLHYGRVPNNNIVLFDVAFAEASYCITPGLQEAANQLGLESVPVFFEGEVRSQDDLEELLQRESFLGSVKIEGVVVKNYSRFGRDDKPLMGKYVSPAFRETQKISWKAANPGGAEIRQRIADNLKVDRRWEKVVEHLRDAGQLENSPRDIGPLIRELNKDLVEECEPLIKDMLWDWARKDILRMATNGFPEWYKQRLLNQQFGEVSNGQE